MSELKPYHEHLVKCPKCHGGMMSGPEYRSARPLDEEYMEWRCGVCGFIDKTRPMDAASKPLPDEENGPAGGMGMTIDKSSRRPKAKP